MKKNKKLVMKKNKSGFNLEAKALLLSYSNVKNLCLQDLVSTIHKIANNLKIKVIGYVATMKDTYANKRRKQGHIYVSFSQKIRFKNPKVFDIKRFHPAVVKPRTQRDAIKYVMQGITKTDSLNNNLFMSSSAYDDLQIMINDKGHCRSVFDIVNLLETFKNFTAENATNSVLTTVETQTVGGQIQVTSSRLTDTNETCKYCDDRPVVIKKRGRPKKAINRIIDVNLPVVVKKRGRPKKTTHKEP